jgi:hypothetical protein
MHRDGRLGADELVAGERAFATGDRIVARRNDRRSGVVNGTRAEVVAVDPKRRTVSIKSDQGDERTLTSAYLDEGWLDHGYALPRVWLHRHEPTPRPGALLRRVARIGRASASSPTTTSSPTASPRC